MVQLAGATLSAVRYKNWKMYYTMSQPSASPLVQNIKRDRVVPRVPGPATLSVSLNRQHTASFSYRLGFEYKN